MPRRWRSNNHQHHCPRCGQPGHTSRECCHVQMWCEAPLKASADLHNVTALYCDQDRTRTEERRVDVRLPVVWGNYAVTADVLSFLSWEEALRGVASVNRSAYEAFSTVFGGSIRNGLSVTEQPRPLSLRGFRLEPLNAWEATAIVRQLVSAAHSDRTAPRSAAADDDAASDYCPSEAPSSVGAGTPGSRRSPGIGLTTQSRALRRTNTLVDMDGNVLLEMHAAAVALHHLGDAGAPRHYVSIHRSFRPGTGERLPDHWPEKTISSTEMFRVHPDSAHR